MRISQLQSMQAYATENNEYPEYSEEEENFDEEDEIETELKQKETQCFVSKYINGIEI